jgi:hypothetical protein
MNKGNTPAMFIRKENCAAISHENGKHCAGAISHQPVGTGNGIIKSLRAHNPLDTVTMHLLGSSNIAHAVTQPSNSRAVVMAQVVQRSFTIHVHINPRGTEKQRMPH